MLSGEVQGQFLSMLSCMKKPMHILEIGTFTGYSALCLAKGLDEAGKLHTIENRIEDAQTASGYFNQSKYAHQIKLHIGDAKEIIPTLPHIWDMVFIDANKTGYIEYYEMVLPKLAPGGIIIADNVLFHGEVLENTISGKNAIAIHAFNEHVKNDARTTQVLLTIRDGMLLIQKKQR
jgi:predicted O-methyltransferase YrrM